MSGYDIEKNLATYRQACRKGTDWLLNLMNQDGSIGPAQERLYYYRVPWAFALMGEITAASRVLDWVHRHMFSPEGAFEGLEPRDGKLCAVKRAERIANRVGRSSGHKTPR